jgi:hypothetical protein
VVTRETVRDFFRDVTARGIDLARPLRWGFFILGRNPVELEQFATELTSDGLALVRVFEAEPAETPPVFYLETELICRFSADALFQRLTTIDTKSLEHGLLGVDGFDVGNVDGSPLF